MRDLELTPELAAAGARHVMARAPDPLTADWLLVQAADNERVLRLQFEGHTFPEEWEAHLKELEGTDITTALRRWGYVAHIWRVCAEDLRKSESTSEEDGAATARQILRRVPVMITLRGRRVAVTSRSYSAMAEMAAHEAAVRSLTVDLRELANRAARIEEISRSLSLFARWRRGSLARLRARYQELYRKLLTERELHRRAIYAHALTAHGGPARDVAAEAPDWWREMGPEEDSALLAALFEVGPVRYRKLGPPPPRQRDGGASWSEHFGFANLFAAWEKETNLAPAELYDRDLAQQLTEMRASAIEFPDPKRE